MEQYIPKSAVVAEIERRLEKIANASSEGNRELSAIHGAQQCELINLVQYIDTLEVKEIHEDIDMDLNPFFEELGVEPDSRIAYTFKEAFYKGIDRYLNKKENQVKQINQ